MACRFLPKMDARRRRRRHLERIAAPRAAVPRPRASEAVRARVREVLRAGDQLRVVFQPIVDLVTGDVVGYEALSRFPTGSPDEWFAEAHALGLGIDFEMAAIVQSVALRHPGWGYVSINVSPATLLSQDFGDLVARLDAPHRLVVELTEHVAVDDYDRLRATLDGLRAAGVRVAVDDAGSGISSFRHILAIVPDIVKLDRSLIARLETDVPRRALAEALVHFARRIGAQLVAEGIEREEERAACVELGITCGQGYLIGRPHSVG